MINMKNVLNGYNKDKATSTCSFASRQFGLKLCVSMACVSNKLIITDTSL